MWRLNGVVFMLFFFSLIAYELEQFFDELLSEQNVLKKRDRRRVTIDEVCRQISKYFGYFQYKSRAIYNYVRSRKMQKDLVNPIQVDFFSWL